jgi:hypothetical protein
LGLLLLLVLAAPLSAQREVVQRPSSFSLEGPVRYLRESVYISHHFQVNGWRFKDAEKSVMTGFGELHFDTLGSLTYKRMFRQQPFTDQTDTFEYDVQGRMAGHVWMVGNRPVGSAMFTHNLLDQLVSVRQFDDTGALFCETAYRYRDGRISEEKTFSRAYVMISEIRYTYDSLKRLVREECPWNPYRYAVPYVKEYAYDANGWISSIRYSEKDVSRCWVYHRVSDRSGKILSESTCDKNDSLLKIRHYRYGFRGRIKQEVSLDGQLHQDIRYRYRKGRLHAVRNRYGDVDFRTFYLKYDKAGNWVEKVEYDGINLQVTTREITYGDQPLKMKKTAPSRQSPAQR